ncbi:hypothetical protein B5P45_04130, partial [Phyllobacterium zundukense]
MVVTVFVELCHFINVPDIAPLELSGLKQQTRAGMIQRFFKQPCTMAHPEQQVVDATTHAL